MKFIYLLFDKNSVVNVESFKLPYKIIPLRISGLKFSFSSSQKISAPELSSNLLLNHKKVNS